jgi:NTE family protein
MLPRDLLKSALVGSAALVSAVSASARAAETTDELEVLVDQLNRELFDNDGLARAIPKEPTLSELAKGRDRTLVLGGENYVARYSGFFHGLYEQGPVMNEMSEMVVGTSAGSYMGSSLTSGHFSQMRREFKFFRHFPELFG